MACWAPLVPFVKQKLVISESYLGLLLLCLGIGSVIAMLIVGKLIARYGNRVVIGISGCALTLVLPLLVLSPNPPTLALTLFAFGATLGSLDVAINIHAVEVEQFAKRPLMSGFHALFSTGGFFGAATMTFLLSINIALIICCLLCAIAMLFAMLLAWPRLHTSKKTEDGAGFAFPKGIVILLALLTAIAFLMEGAILDWSALLVTEKNLVPQTQGGLAYMLFSISMMCGRFIGDRMSIRFSDHAIIFWGALLAAAGIALVLIMPHALTALSGFLLLGFGAANIVPVLFRRAGNQKIMPVGPAIAAVSIAGYSGILLGPAVLGFIADVMGLSASFWILVVLLCFVAAAAKHATRGN